MVLGGGAWFEARGAWAVEGLEPVAAVWGYWRLAAWAALAAGDADFEKIEPIVLIVATESREVETKNA